MVDRAPTPQRLVLVPHAGGDAFRNLLGGPQQRLDPCVRVLRRGGGRFQKPAQVAALGAETRSRPAGSRYSRMRVAAGMPRSAISAHGMLNKHKLGCLGQLDVMLRT